MPPRQTPEASFADSSATPELRGSQRLGQLAAEEEGHQRVPLPLCQSEDVVPRPVGGTTGIDEDAAHGSAEAGSDALIDARPQPATLLGDGEVLASAAPTIGPPTGAGIAQVLVGIA